MQHSVIEKMHFLAVSFRKFYVLAEILLQYFPLVTNSRRSYFKIKSKRKKIHKFLKLFGPGVATEKSIYKMDNFLD
ncbi:hypothetical protein X975_04542, partial [Stegodyphus mimosarum]